MIILQGIMAAAKQKASLSDELVVHFLPPINSDPERPPSPKESTIIVDNQ
jgi:hypothetical protein